MSVTPTPPPKPSPTSQGTSALPTIVGTYVLSALVIVGVFVLIAIGKLGSDTGIPLVAVIVGVHGGSAITNNSTRP